MHHRKAALVCVPHLAYLAWTAAARWQEDFKGECAASWEVAPLCFSHLSSTCVWENLSLQDAAAKQVLLHLQKTHTCFLHFGDELGLQAWKDIVRYGGF